MLACVQSNEDPPGGDRPGGSGDDTGWMRRPCRTQIHRVLLEITDAIAADVLVEDVVLGLPVAAAQNRIAVNRLLARGDCGTENKAGRKADAKVGTRVVCLSFLGGGSNATCHDESSDGES